MQSTSANDITKKPSETDWEGLAAMSDDEIDYSDIPPLPDTFFERAKVWRPQPKVTVAIEVDADLRSFAIDTPLHHTYNASMIKFEWDPQKARANVVHHGVSFEEAATVFYDDYARQFFDEDHSTEEDRFIMLGVSNRLRILVVCHCERAGGNIIRIISARKATAYERTFYEGPIS